MSGAGSGRAGAAMVAVVLVVGMLAVSLGVLPASAAAQDSSGLCDSAGVEQFSDVAEGDYGAAYALCARAVGLSQGTGGGEFSPDGKLSREQMAKFLVRLWRDSLKRPCPSEPAHSFTDVASSFAVEEIACLYALGITKGTTDTTYSPTGDLSTAAVTRFLARLLNEHQAGTCDLSGDELAAAAACLVGLNVAPSAGEAASSGVASRAQMTVYLMGAWHRASGRGQPPEPPTRPTQSGTTPAPATRLQAISAGDDHTCGITTNSDAVCWGYNSYGEARAPTGKFKAISAGGTHSCAITTGGDALCWGADGATDAPAGKFKAISAGDGHSCAITTGGDAVCWGANSFGAADAPAGKFKAISAGDGHSCAITTDGDPVCWGISSWPDELTGQYQAISVGGGPFVGLAACGLKTNGTAVCWSTGFASTEQEIHTLPGRFEAISVSAGSPNWCGIETHGDVVCTGLGAPAGKFSAISVGGVGQEGPDGCGITTSGDTVCWNLQPTTFGVPSTNFKTISLGWVIGGGDGSDWQFIHRSCGITLSGTTVCWGDVGIDAGDESPPWQGLALQSMSVGTSDLCGIKTNGDLVCWIVFDYEEYSVPAGEFTAISVGDSRSCGITTGGEAVCWGTDRFGQLDAPPGKFSEISAGAFHSCGITTGGEAVCWGDNAFGQSDAPAGKFTAISASYLHSCGITTNSDAVCWGYDGYDAPAGKFSAVSAGRNHSCGITTGGEAVCWGDNRFGQSDAPAGKFTAISAGGSRSCGIRTDKTAVCWGNNIIETPSFVKFV